MVNTVTHKANFATDSDEDTESEEIKSSAISSARSPEVSPSCFQDLFPNNLSERTVVPLHKKLFTNFAAKRKIKITRKHNSKQIDDFLREMAGGRPTCYSLEQIKSFSWNFSTQIGVGGFGATYKGLTPNGLNVAIKIMRAKHNEDEFMAEVRKLSRTYHRNIVRLLGYCVENGVLALVYEYAANGSLDNFLLDSCEGANWKTLYNVVIGIAKGMVYLHEDCEDVIIHMDIKPSNILVSSNFSAKLSDFGLAVEHDHYVDGVDVLIRGTPGYISPEIFTSSYATFKSDVYGFGKVLFDILRRRHLHNNYSQQSYIELLWEEVERGTLENFLAKHDIEGNYTEQAVKMSLAALWCIQINPHYRPSMSTVVTILKGDIEVVRPPSPFPISHNSFSYGSTSYFYDYSETTMPVLESGSEFYTLITEKYETEMAISSDNQIMEPKTYTPIYVLNSFRKNIDAHCASTSRTICSVGAQGMHRRDNFPSKYMKSFPSKFVQHIQYVKDVKGDGNCGFRAIADLLGKTENGWVSVRKDLRDELHVHWEDYSRLYENCGSINKLKKSLEHYEGDAPRDCWMDMPDVGHIIASRYNVVLVHISLEQCLTFLPLRSPPLPQESHEIICIGFVNGNHYVRLDLQQRCPLPSIADRWHIFRHPCAEGWKTSYTSRIKRFEQLVIGENVALRETPIDMDTGSYSSSSSLSDDSTGCRVPRKGR